MRGPGPYAGSGPTHEPERRGHGRAASHAQGVLHAKPEASRECSRRSPQSGMTRTWVCASHAQGNRALRARQTGWTASPYHPSRKLFRRAPGRAWPPAQSAMAGPPVPARPGATVAARAQGIPASRAKRDGRSVGLRGPPATRRGLHTWHRIPNAGQVTSRRQLPAPAHPPFRFAGQARQVAPAAESPTRQAPKLRPRPHRAAQGAPQPTHRRSGSTHNVPVDAAIAVAITFAIACRCGCGCGCGCRCRRTGAGAGVAAAVSTPLKPGQPCLAASMRAKRPAPPASGECGLRSPGPAAARRPGRPPRWWSPSPSTRRRSASWTG